MRNYTVEKTAYKYDELSERAKDNARIKFSCWFMDTFDVRGDYDQDCWIDRAEHSIKSYEIGYWDTNPIDASFKEIDLDIDQLIARVSDSIRDQRNLYRLARALFFNGALDSLIGVSCEPYRGFDRGYRNKGEIDFSSEKHMRLNSLCEKYAEKISDHVQDCAHKIARTINSEIEFSGSEEYAQDMAEANEYEFDEHGNLI